MNRSLPTFSSLPRWRACEACHVLPQADGTTAASAAGDARHLFFLRIGELMRGDQGSATLGRRSLADARELALAEVEDGEARRALSAIPIDVLVRMDLENVAGEVAFAIDVETGDVRELGRNIGRAYDAHGRKPTEVCGSVDRVALLGGGRGYVGDYKGRGHTRAPSKDWQFLAGAFATSRVYQLDEVEIEVIRCIGPDAFHHLEEVDVVDLDVFELELRDLVDRVKRNQAAFDERGELPPATTGEHCTYCPSYSFCPAKLALARAVLGGDSEEIRALATQGRALITPENAPRLRELVQEAGKILEKVKEALADYARATPFRMPNGKVYGANPDYEEREIVDGRKALEVLEELYGAEAAKEAAKVSVSFEGIDRATRAKLGDKIQRGDLSAWSEKAEQRLEERGLLRRVKGGKVAEFIPAAEKPAKKKTTAKKGANRAA